MGRRLTRKVRTSGRVTYTSIYAPNEKRIHLITNKFLPHQLGSWVGVYIEATTPRNPWSNTDTDTDADTDLDWRISGQPEFLPIWKTPQITNRNCFEWPEESLGRQSYKNKSQSLLTSTKSKPWTLYHPKKWSSSERWFCTNQGHDSLPLCTASHSPSNF